VPPRRGMLKSWLSCPKGCPPFCMRWARRHRARTLAKPIPATLLSTRWGFAITELSIFGYRRTILSTTAANGRRRSPTRRARRSPGGAAPPPPARIWKIAKCKGGDSRFQSGVLDKPRQGEYLLRTMQHTASSANLPSAAAGLILSLSIIGLLLPGRGPPL
jgi:hypothetical protein